MSGTKAARQRLGKILNSFQPHTLLNKVRARRDFYSATINYREKMLSFISRVGHLASFLQLIGITIDDFELAMAVLKCLLERLFNIIAVPDALGDKSMSLYEVKSRLLQEEQRSAMRNSSSTLESALYNSSHCTQPPNQRPDCTHCEKRSYFNKTCGRK